MNLEQMPFRALVKWLWLGVAFVVAACILTVDNMSGLIPVACGFVHLWLFRPPKAQLTDADLDALLGRA
jgi:hypothetical protein